DEPPWRLAWHGAHSHGATRGDHPCRGLVGAADRHEFYRAGGRAGRLRCDLGTYRSRSTGSLVTLPAGSSMAPLAGAPPLRSVPGGVLPRLSLSFASLSRPENSGGGAETAGGGATCTGASCRMPGGLSAVAQPTGRSNAVEIVNAVTKRCRICRKSL